MKKVDLEWKIKDFYVSFNCPNCDDVIDQKDFENIMISNGEEFEGQIVCPACKKFFVIDLKNPYEGENNEKTE
ncbi:MAG: hypothetical protein GY853_09845 [PVC group bacterium]|nr:hypothetical protein [PVC group bacterium]